MSINRRELLATAGALGASALLSRPVRAEARAPLEIAAEQAYLYALPLIEMAESRALSLASESASVNRIFHDRDLATARFRSVTTPNNDTLYSRAWIDLSAGPVTLEIPEIVDRYISAGFLDMYSNYFAIFGTRTSGSAAVRITLVGPDAPLPDPQAIRSPTRWVWLLVRTAVDGPDDIPAVRRLQDAIRLTAPASPPPPAFAGRSAPWQDYFESAQRLVAENVPPLTDLAAFHIMAPLGFGPRGGFNAARFAEKEGAQIEAGIRAARLKLEQRAKQGPILAGWAYGKYNIGSYGQDYLFRAQVALGGLGALPREEAMYMRAIADTGRIFFAPDTRYRLRFEAGQLPPVDAFWSMTMYERTSEGQFYLAENMIERYSIGDRTDGLRYATDGSLTLWLGPDRPADADAAANWLPSPRGQEWSVVFRTYLPGPALLSGAYLLPRLERLEN